MTPRVLIYRSELLPYSETFIAAQAGAMASFLPAFAGLRRVRDGIHPPQPCWVLAEGLGMPARARRWMFRRMGVASGWYRAIRAWNPALLHAHFATDAAEALPLVRLLKVPFVTTLHGYDVMAHDAAHRKTARGRAYLARREELFARADLFLCVSDAIRRRALERGFPPHKLHVHAIGAALCAGPPPSSLPASPIILFVGRLVEKKGCRYLLRAMKQVQAILPAARLVVLGEGPERTPLQQQTQAESIHAQFLGAQSKTEVTRWMSQARVLAVPSVTASDGDAEGLPTVLGEALSLGLPVAAFRSAGIPELVRDGVEGLLADERDEEALARNLVRLCQDDALATRLVAAGRRRLEDHYELHAQTRVLEAIYAELLTARHGAVLRRQHAQHPQHPQQQHGLELPTLAAAAERADTGCLVDMNEALPEVLEQACPSGVVVP